MPSFLIRCQCLWSHPFGAESGIIPGVILLLNRIGSQHLPHFLHLFFAIGLKWGRSPISLPGSREKVGGSPRQKGSSRPPKIPQISPQARDSSPPLTLKVNCSNTYGSRPKLADLQITESTVPILSPVSCASLLHKISGAVLYILAILTRCLSGLQKSNPKFLAR